MTDSLRGRDTRQPPPPPPPFDDPLGDEWANTLTHAVSCALAVLGWIAMAWLVRDRPVGLQTACLVYATSAVAVFFFSTLSHAARKPHWRERMRAWDQGVIYVMISGTYTPFAYAFGGSLQLPTLVFLWVVATIGFVSKVIVKHRVHAIGTASYLLLGWLPAMALGPQVTWGCLLGMAAGGVVYTVGVVFLVNDQRRKYMHAVWHLLVLTAAAIHFATVVICVVFAEAN